MIIPFIGLGPMVRSVRGLVLVSGVGTGYARRAVFWVLLSWQLCCLPSGMLLKQGLICSLLSRG